jgi:hypothetical protein
MATGSCSSSGMSGMSCGHIVGFSVSFHSIVFFAFCRAMEGIGPYAVAVKWNCYTKSHVSSLAKEGDGGQYFWMCSARRPSSLAEPSRASCTTALVVMGLVGVAATLRNGHHPNHAGFADLDPIGSVLGVVGLVLVNFSNQGPGVGRNQVYVYAVLIVGIGFLAELLFVEFKITECILLPSATFSRDTSLVFACIAAGWASFGIWVYCFWVSQNLSCSCCFADTS